MECIIIEKQLNQINILYYGETKRGYTSQTLQSCRSACASMYDDNRL